MIKLFRKIRQKLLAGNRTREYVKYAIGEIILVVVGILIALQINTWNQNRLDSNTETQLLQAIKTKIKFNSFQCRTGYNRYKSVLDASVQLINTSTSQSSSMTEEEIDYCLHILSKRFLVGKSNRTSIYDELIGSGQLNLLKSEELRAELTSLKANLEVLASYEDLQTSFVDSHLHPFLNQYSDRLSISVGGFKKDTSMYDKMLADSFLALEVPSEKTMHSNILEKREFVNLLTELIYHTKAILPVYGRIDENIAVIDSLASNAR